MSSAPAHIVQVTTTSYTRDGVIGGGERLALYIDSALQLAAASAGLPLTTTLLALDGRQAIGGYRDHYQTVTGTAWDPYSLNADDLVPRLRPADAVYVHQCLTHVGLFVAAHARLLGKPVFGSDAGGGEAPVLGHNPDIMRIYDAVHALSDFAATAFEGFPVPVHVIKGPVDTQLHRPPAEPVMRDPGLVVSVGRVLPHKGHERVIRALPPGLSLVIVGQHYDKAYLAFLRGCAAGKQVTFEDGLDDAGVRALLHRAGIVVHASTHVDYAGNYSCKPELLGLAPLEALACGAETLVSDAACLPELAVIPGCRVFRDEAELAAMLQAFATSRGESRLPATTMHAAVDQQFGLAVVGSRLLDMMGFTAPCAS